MGGHLATSGRENHVALLHHLKHVVHAGDLGREGLGFRAWGQQGIPGDPKTPTVFRVTPYDKGVTTSSAAGLGLQVGIGAGFRLEILSKTDSGFTATAAWGLRVQGFQRGHEICWRE